MSSKKNCKYSSKTLNMALDAIKNGMPIKTASREYNIPKTTLHYKNSGKYAIGSKVGAPTILTIEEEEILVKWIIKIAEVGFPVSREQLLDSVTMLLKKKKRPNTFKDDRPGRHWFEGFLRRHSQISKRMTQNLSNARAIITETSIRLWFSEIEIYFVENNLNDVMNDPQRVFNADESAFFLCPKGKKALALKGSKTVYNHTSNDEKECITTLITANAAGIVAPPMVMFAYERVPQSIVSLMPNGWGLGKSESGWMTGEGFFEYISNIFHPWLIKNEIPLPILFYVDGHKSHLTMHLSEFCSKNGIVLISLLPNSTHMLQPLDVGIFHPLKNGWKTAVNTWRMESNKQKLKKENFAPLLDKVIKDVITVSMLKSAFKTCGLCPFDPNAINYNKLITNKHTENITISNSANDTAQIEFSQKHLLFLEDLIGSNKINEFKTCFGNGNLWIGAVEDQSLFELWKKLVQHVQTTKLVQYVEINNKDGNNSIQGDDGNQSIENEIPDDALILEAEWLEEYLHTCSENQDDNLHIETPTLIDTRNSNILAIKNNVFIDDKNIEELEREKKNEEEKLEKSLNTNKEVNSEGKGENKTISTEETLETNTTEANDDKENTNTEHNAQVEITDNSKSANCNNLPFKVPSPFKNTLFWPADITKTINKKQNKVKVPSVASSEQWKAFYKSKQDAKIKEQEEKEKTRKTGHKEK